MIRRLCVFLAVLAVSLLTSRPGRAGAPEVQIHLLVMGPGEHLYTRGGHAALLVAEMEDGAPVRSHVYNYGDTDWDDPLLVPNFLRGNLVFFLSDTGELVSTLEEYGVRQGRSVTRQRLNLTPAEAAEVKRRLEEGIAPGKREYLFHHIHALCSTRIMDLLDDVLKGRLRAELAGKPGPYTARHYHETIFAESPLASIGGDLFFGRLHDRVLDRWESAASPENMRDELQAILVPAPSGEGRVPLAEPPAEVVARTEPLVVERSAFTRVLWGALLALLAGAGAGALLRRPGRRERAAKVVSRAALSSGVVGTVMLALMLFSRVPEMRWNELILVFWPLDLWLAWRVRRLVKEGAAPSGWVRGYSIARLAVAGLVVAGHAAGVLYQEPRVLAALGCVEAAVLFAMVRSLGMQPVAKRTPARVPSEATAPAAGA